MNGVNITITGMNEIQKKLEDELRRMSSNKTVLVGIHEDAGTVDDGEFTMAALGATLHFGTDRAGKNNSVSIPPRPWLDVGVAQGTQDYIEAIQQAGSIDKAMDMIGLIAVGKVQDYMAELKSPANAQSTIDQKGFDNPLIHTGELRQSVKYTIDTAKPKEGI